LKIIVKIIVVVIVVLSIFSCSTKKDAYVNRQFHAMSTKYNILYNGEVAFQDGLDALNANYEDNYWDILPIEPLKVDELALPGMQADNDSSPQEFDRAEEKAVKAIQKHSMLIVRQEQNTQIDDAYLLLGKARYFSKRFVPALEAFNYAIINYPNANLIDETRVWQSKANIRIQNPEQAILTLSILLDKEGLDSKVKEAAHTTLAMAYADLDSLQPMMDQLKQATLTHYNVEQTARNLFILGQLYYRLNEKDSSDIAFQKVIDLKKAPYKYKIHAEIEQAKNVSSKEEGALMKDELEDLINDRYNRAYLDELYFRLATIELDDNENLALEHFKKSVLESDGNLFQKELSYEAIGNIYFDKAEFIIAGAYYDSILQIAQDDNSKRIRSLKRKRNKLDELILYDVIEKRNDSILNIVAMTKEEQTAFFNKHIEQLIIEEERNKVFEKQQNSGSRINDLGNTTYASGNGKWYFYNIQAVGFGEQEFRNIWGNRVLEDNWRLSNKIRFNTNTSVTTTKTTPLIDDSKKYELSYYLDNIPKNESEIDSIAVQRNNAYYKLGVIYENQLNETDLAINELETLLTFHPSEELVLPTNYQLYKIYSKLNNEKALAFKNEIIINYPNSQYAKIILNPTEISDKNEEVDSPINVYTSAFYDYEKEEYQQVIEESNKAIAQYAGQEIVPKFELLKAYAIGKKDGLNAFKEALEFVSATYPDTEEGKKALEVLETINTKI
jgi:tetratricopeptide (TPR) repeat protein